MAARKVLVVDADVLIDYANSELDPLERFCKHIGQIVVARLLLDEVDQLDEGKCLELGLEFLDPSTEQLLEAGQGSGALSFTDRLCLILARDHQLACITNDRRLRRACANQNVEVIWGLELMLRLVERKRLAPAAAMKIATKIHQSNPHHIGKNILMRFERKVRKLTGKK